MSMAYNFKTIEKKWQRRWEEKKIFQVKSNSKKKKFYCLEMFPYPSGTGLHMGHAFNYTIGDIYSRFKRMNGFNVLYPMGYDSFGLPAENAAIKEGAHPKKYIESAIKNYTKQLKNLGMSYDWTRVFNSHDPGFYKWDQWIFLKMFEKGFAYQKESAVNWCPKCNTVLANEQVQGGKCWRHEDTDVEIKQLKQWFFKITNYSDELYECIDKLEGWAEDVKAMQRNWIGKSYGTEIIFDINGKKWPVFTTRPDTIYGVTFMVISAQHPQLFEIVTGKQKKEVEKFLKKIKSVSEKDLEELEKEGVFTGNYAVNPITKDKIPVYAGNFVVADYGSGMVMAVPAHDQRDFEFAEKYKLPIKEVIKGGDIKERAYTGEGVLINSGEFNGINSKDAIEKITKFLQKKKLGKKTIQYKLKDWLISRQRYWGTPIPIVYCDKCGVVPISKEKLPLKLPEKVKFGKGNPLRTAEKWIKTKCPKCGKNARRETDTMDTFVNSSWYFLRYCDPHNNKEIFDKKKVNYWMPMDIYIGGKEHACLHLIYFRFYTKFLRDIGLLKIDEPTLNQFNQGMLHGEDGFVMSKSRGNVVLPEVISNKYGIDASRIFLVSIASPDKDIIWSEKGIKGSFKFINKIMDYFDNFKLGKADSRTQSKLNKTIKEITYFIEDLKYNLAVIKIRELFNSLPKKTSKDVLEKSLKLLHPFCPHITEELWEKLGNKKFISLEKWPVVDEKKINEKFEKQEQFARKVGEDINRIKGIVKIDKPTAYIYAVPSDLPIIKENKELISTISGANVVSCAVNDKDKYDPENKSKKAKPGRPGIYLE